MRVTAEDIAAHADGQLDPLRDAEVAAAIAADDELAAQLAAHQVLKARLAGHFAPILQQPVPDHLAAMLRPNATPAADPAPVTSLPSVASLADAREKRQQRSLAGKPRWLWFAGPALAAGLALAVVLPGGGGSGGSGDYAAGGDYAGGALADTLDGQLVATQDQAGDTRILLSFQDKAGAFCRAFADPAQSGVACRDDQGWRIIFDAAGADAQQGDYRMAGNATASVMEQAQAMASGPALDAAQEQQAKARGWR